MGGQATVSLTADQNGLHNHSADHTHTINDPGHLHGASSAQNEGGANNNTWDFGADPFNIGAQTYVNTTGITINTASVTTSNQGSGQAHNNMQPYIVHNHFVRVK